jgi:hypothetical protein
MKGTLMLYKVFAVIQVANGLHQVEMTVLFDFGRLPLVDV